MDTLERLHNCSLKQLDEILSNDKYKSRDDIHSAYELIDIVKDVWCVWKYQDGDDEYSEYGMPETYPYRGRSYARGRGAKRDSMGRYSREGSNYRGRGRGYSLDDAKQDYIELLREMMEDAPDEMTRQKIQRMVHEMEEE